MEVYLNLTNGVEYLRERNVPLKFIRIQSTACEQKRWDFILQELDYGFLMDLALGKEVLVVDYSSRKPIPRSIYQGLEFIKYALNRAWFGKDTEAFVRGNDSTKYFRECYAKLEKRTLKKLEYFKKFLRTKELKIKTFTAPTAHDGDYEYYRGILHDMDYK